MMYLLLSVLLNAYIGIAFAFFNRHKVDLFQAIVYNYAICVLTGSMMMGEFPINAIILEEPFFKWALLMGVLFISVFNLIAISSTEVGVTITQTANKLSLVIPVIFSYFLYHENISMMKMAGILIALFAVVLVSMKAKNKGRSHVPLWEYGLPVILFFSSGIIDALTKYVQQSFLNSEPLSNAYLILGFFTAFVVGVIVLIFLYATGKKKFHGRNIIAGIVLGVPNYFSIYFLVKALQSNTMNSSAIIPINNIGVLFLVSLVGIFMFNEKLTRNNFIGLGLTLVAILLIFLGDKY